MINEGGIVSGSDMPGVVYHTGMRAMFTTNLPSAEMPRPSEVVIEKQHDQQVAFWGEMNDFPQLVLKDIEKSDIVPTVLDWKARTLVGEGVAYGNLVEGPGGSAILKPMFVPEIDRWLTRTNFDLYCYEAALDHYTFYNANAEVQRSRDGKVAGIFAQDQSWLRFSENNDAGEINKAYLSACWDTATDVNDKKKVITLEALDPYYDVVGQLQASKNFRHILPLRLQRGGRKYYQLAPWNGLRASGWMELAVAIPKMKLRLIQNMMQIRYWIEIADEYWPKRFGEKEWKDASTPDRQKLIKKEVKDFEELMAGEEEIGKPKALMTRMNLSQHAKDMISLWKVHPLKMEIPTGAYVEDSAETDFHVVRGLGVDPALTGISPGKNSASPGSGSADRVKRTNYLLAERPAGTRLLSPMSAASEINGWDKDHNGGKPLVWMFRSLHTATLDRTTQVSTTETGNTGSDGTV